MRLNGKVFLHFHSEYEWGECALLEPKLQKGTCDLSIRMINLIEITWWWDYVSIVLYVVAGNESTRKIYPSYLQILFNQLQYFGL